jgi:HK97 family phage prohead protease
LIVIEAAVARVFVRHCVSERTRSDDFLQAGLKLSRRIVTCRVTAKIISRVESGTLRLKEDGRGLWFDSDIDLSVSYASDLYNNIKNGNVSECSFGFYVVRENYANQKDGSILRELLEVRCFDVSPVIQPQYSGGVTNVSARSMFPEGMPASVEVRSKLAASDVAVDDRTLAAMRARLELAKRKSL